MSAMPIIGGEVKGREGGKRGQGAMGPTSGVKHQGTASTGRTNLDETREKKKKEEGNGL